MRLSPSTQTSYISITRTPPVLMPVFFKLIHIAVKCVQFNLNNTLYAQIDGIARGSLLGAALANIFVGIQEKRLFKLQTNHFLATGMSTTLSSLDVKADGFYL